jgi:hypothetical protein
VYQAIDHAHAVKLKTVEFDLMSSVDQAQRQVLRLTLVHHERGNDVTDACAISLELRHGVDRRREKPVWEASERKGTTNLVAPHFQEVARLRAHRPLLHGFNVPDPRPSPVFLALL